MTESIVKKVKKLYGVDIDVSVTDRSIVLRGEMDNWQDIVKVGKMFVDKKSGKHVVNDIVLRGYVEPQPYLPSLSDSTLQDTTWDVVVIGGGVVGCAVARELSQLDCPLCL